jgi:flagellar protein FlbD
MITLHRLGRQVEAFMLNPDLIMTVEANPDTVITLTTGVKIVVAEPPERIAADFQRYRSSVLADALASRHQQRIAHRESRRIGASRLTAAPAVHAASAEHAAL